jgi:hypothetical protein
MATCSTDVIVKAFDDLWTKGVLENGKTRINELGRFIALNNLYTEVARRDYGVTNPGSFFTVNSVMLSPGPLFKWNSRKSFPATFAVVNREFSDEFQKKYTNVLEQKALEEPYTESVPATLSTTLQPKYDDIRNVINNAGYPEGKRLYLLNELNTSRTPADFGALLKKLC